MSDREPMYDAGDEGVHIVTVSNRVAWERTPELVERWLPPAPAHMLDTCSGPGRYAAWLAERGYTVQQSDPVPTHIRQARTRGVVAAVGDAPVRPFDDRSADASMTHDPLYHLLSASAQLRYFGAALENEQLIAGRGLRLARRTPTEWLGASTGYR